MVDTDPAVKPTVSGGTPDQPTTSEATVAGVFAGVTVADSNAGNPTETVTITVGGTGGTLSGGGVAPTGTNTYTLTGTVAQVNAALGAIIFKPTAGQANTQNTTSFSITDTSSVGGAAAAADTTPSVVDTDPAVKPTVSGGGATATTQNAPVKPFTSASVSDSNVNSTDTLAIQVLGSGTLSGTGLGGGTNGLYTLSGTAGAVTGELEGLTFTPAANAPGTTTTTTFALTDTTTAGTSATNAATSVTDTVSPTQPPAPTTDTVSISPTVTYANGIFTLSGTASSTAGVPSVEVSAMVDGTRQDLGPATVAANGSFTFQDAIGASQQTFFVATETDTAGGQATSSDPGFNLTGGLGPRGGAGLQEKFDATGRHVSSTLFRPDGGHVTSIDGPGQTVNLQPYDIVANHHQSDTTFVYTPSDDTGVIDVIQGFHYRGADHDVVSLSGADFGNSIANVLRNTGDVNGSAFITDPVTGDAIRLAGVSTAELKRSDFTFHA